MKRLIIALALVLALAPGCNDPQPDPFRDPVFTKVVNPTRIPGTAEAARDTIQWFGEAVQAAYKRQGPHYICGTAISMCWRYIDIWDRSTEQQLYVLFLSEVGCVDPNPGGNTCHDVMNLNEPYTRECTDESFWEHQIDAILAAEWDTYDFRLTPYGWYVHTIEIGEVKVTFQSQVEGGPAIGCPAPRLWGTRVEPDNTNRKGRVPGMDDEGDGPLEPRPEFPPVPPESLR